MNPDPREVSSRLVEFLASERAIVGESEALGRQSKATWMLPGCHTMLSSVLCYVSSMKSPVPYETRYLYGLTSSNRQRLRYSGLVWG